MAVKAILLLSVTVIMFLSQNVCGFPRDGSFVLIEDVNGNENSSPKLKSNEPGYETSSAVVQSPRAIHRVACDNQYEEPTEDLVCQEHCLPKGYSYGLCVSKTCTCI